MLRLGVLRIRPMTGRLLLQVRAVAVQLAAVDVLAQLLLAAAERARLSPADLRRPLTRGPVRVQPRPALDAFRRDGVGAADGISEVGGKLAKLHARQATARPLPGGRTC